MLTSFELTIKRHFKPILFRSLCFAGRIIARPIKKITSVSLIKKILIVQGGGIGDAIRIFPMLRALSDSMPDTSVSILSPFDQRIFSLCPSLEKFPELIIFDPAKQHRSVTSKVSLALSLRKKSYDLIICPQIGLGMIELEALSFLIGAPYRIGYDMNGSGFLYTARVPLQSNSSIYNQHIDLLHKSGIEKNKIDEALSTPFIAVPDKDMEFARSFLEENDIRNQDRLFTVSPVVMADRDSRSPQHSRPLSELRSWPEDNYSVLIQRLTRSGGAKVILIGDSISRGALSKLLEEKENPNIISAIGRTTIAQSAALIKLSHIFISNDSGMLHVAAALNKKCIGIFGSTNPEQVMPSSALGIFLWKGVPCSPCFIHQPVPDFICSRDLQCLKSLSVDEVMEAIATLSKNS